MPDEYIIVVSLPMRDGNTVVGESPLVTTQVVSLPMRDGNRGASRL